MIVSACGNKKSDGLNENIYIGFPSDYTPPQSDYNQPDVIDPNFKILEPTIVDPYWISALEMDNGSSVIDKMLFEHDRTLAISFPKNPPNYIPLNIVGWSPATKEMISASHKIFLELEKILDISIEERENPDGLNNFAISQSIQPATSGFAYFPNNHFQLGSDIIVSKDYSEPLTLQSGMTNYDYEVLLHEIGHALGLKHPFASDGNNESILSDHEDQTKFTAMSYDSNPSTFDGSFRPLDLMTLTKFYGVRADFRPNDDTYSFDDQTGVFIIDGNGNDTIRMSNSVESIFIDLRVGSHSYEGKKSIFITDPKQLTISHGSEIENVETGAGNDIIVGNQLSNIIISGTGDDIIFAGEGADTIYSGPGNDTVDLSENFKATDILVINDVNEIEYFDSIYGFDQGISGDIIDFTRFDLSSLKSLPIIDVSNVPAGHIDNCIVKIFGPNLSYQDNLSSYFEKSNILENLKLSKEEKAILVTAGSQNTGEDQNIFLIDRLSNSFEVQHLLHLQGNYLDIDNWATENFLV